MQLIQPFNAQQYDPSQSIGSLPIGKHPVVVESSEVKANKSGDGGYLQLNLRIIEGPQTGTTGAYRLNLYHANQQTVEIAHRQLSAVCHVLGVFNVTDSSQLHEIPFIIEVGPQKNDAQYTEVKKVFDIKGNEPNKASAAVAQQPHQPSQATGFGQPQQPQASGFQQQQSAPQQAPQAPQAPQQVQGGGAWGSQPHSQPQSQPVQWGQAPQQQPQGSAPASSPAPWSAR